MSFVACVSNEASLQANLLRSPCLGPGSPHEVLLLRDCRSAAEGLNRGRAQARNPLVVCVHQDVYLPRGWPQRLLQQYRLAEATLGPVGVLGVYGAVRQGAGLARVGFVVDRDRLLREATPLPAAVESLDELLLVVPRASAAVFDPHLGFHLYGADFCLSCRRQGRTAVAVDALCFHHSRSVGLPDDFYASGRVLARKWADQLPIATTCALVQ